MVRRIGMCGELPLDLVALIQARLPLVSLLRWRAVCKAWNATVAQPFFLQQRLELRGGVRERLLCILGFWDSHEGFCLYDPASNGWSCVQLPPWIRTEAFETHLACLHHNIGSTGDGVLLCIESWQQPKQGFIIQPYIGNPVARSWASLPAFLDGLGIRHVVGLLVDVTARCFKLVAVRDTRKPWIRAVDRDEVVPTFVFNSAVGGDWNETASTLPRNKFFSKFSSQGVFVDTVLYCVAAAEISNYDCNLLAFDLQRASWSWLAVAKPSLFYFFSSTLVNVQDRLLCVAAGWHHEMRHVCVQILELDFTHMAWIVVGIMPASMLTYFESLVKAEEYIKIVRGQDFEIYIVDGGVGRDRCCQFATNACSLGRLHGGVLCFMVLSVRKDFASHYYTSSEL